MTAEKFVTIFCDAPGCLVFIESGTGSVPEARRIARAEGWTQTPQRQDRCPAHVVPGDPR